MASIEEKIEKAHYVASEQDVELLAAAHLACDEATKRTDGAYLRILIAGLQAQFGRPTRGKRKELNKADLDTQSTFLADLHGKLYQAVLRGVATNEVAVNPERVKPDEQRRRVALINARANFARSAASTIQSYIRAGGDIRTLVVETVTKSGLRTWVRASQGAPPSVGKIESALHRIELQARAMMADNPDEARELVEECVRRLQSLLHTTLPVRAPVGVESGVFQRRRGLAAAA